MLIKSLTLTNFRNHKEKNLEFGPKINLIIGPNASGKSNILEAIYFFSTGEFIKSEEDKDVLSDKTVFSSAEACVEGDNNNTSLKIQLVDNGNFVKRTYLINNISRLKSKLLGIFYSVFFGPQSLEIITETPSIRRQYLDFVLCQTSSDYLKDRALYDKALRSKNKILESIRDFGASKDQLEFWNIELAEYGHTVTKERENFIKFVNSEIRKHSKPAGLESLELNYLKNEATAEGFKEKQEKEIVTANSLCGPHRDDFEVLNNSKNLKVFGSRGEQRSAIFSLKLCELSFLQSLTHWQPSLLLDDVFSELDNKHREAIMKTLGSYQVILTSADETLVPEEIKNEAKIFRL